MLTPEQRQRFGRQIRLAGVGEEGQAKLCAAGVGLASQAGFARRIEEQYLRAAGVGIADISSGTISVDLGLRHEAAIEVGQGALAALVAIRRVLEDGSG